MQRAIGSLRRLVRRRRAPGPSEQEWLRLILLVRRMQRGQLAVAQRLDEIRALTGVLGSFRSDFAALHDQLGAARESAAELERGLSERLAKLDQLPDPREERVALERRLGALDALAGRLETLAARAPSASVAADEMRTVLGRLDELSARLDAFHGAERALDGQDELAQLYERIQELAEGLVRAPAERGPAVPVEELEQRLASFGAQLEEIESAVRALGSRTDPSAQERTLARIERLATRLERRSQRSAPPAGLPPEDLIPLLARIEALTVRMEQTPAGTESSSEPGAGGHAPEVARELDELRVTLACEQEARRRAETELENGRERLRASELARVELETRQATELSQMADHLGRQLQRVEDDLKKKKRGLAELTQQNITLQAQLTRLTGGSKADPASEPPPALPRGPREGPRNAPEPERAPEGQQGG